MNYLILNIMLSLVWAMLNGEINPANLIVGFIFGYFVLFLARGALGPSPYFGRALNLIHFAAFFLYEIFNSNIKVARDVLTSRHYMKPRIIAVPLDARTDAEITLLANLISLTPGSLSLDVSGDKKTIYVHTMYAGDADAAKREIKDGLERWVLKLLSEGKREGHA
jgi:multicomponent Na+:H+ antiporter subunit E